jgi:pimeloyl-ACP methyl ester carboxylesterase
LLPSLIKVGLITGRSDVIYVGHSSGTTLVFMVASDFDEIKHFLKGIIALSPIAYLDPRDSPSDSLNHLVLLLVGLKEYH